MSRVGSVRLLECEPSLGEGLSEGERAAAGKALSAPALTLKAGRWRPGRRRFRHGGPGYLVLRGLLVRRVEVGRGSSVELLGRGDLLRPWQEDASSFCTASWEVLEEARLAVLSRGLERWPAVAANLAARSIERSRALAADSAIASIVGLEERLLVLLWRIAERWGEARADGVRVSVRLPHRLLAELAGARRPSVTSALAGLREAGRLDSTAGGRWVLLGDPPPFGGRSFSAPSR